MRATVPYPPLYRSPTFTNALEHFRDAERRSLEATDLFQRGAERVVLNSGLFDSRRSSTDGVEIQEILPEDQVDVGPADRQLDVEHDLSPQVGQDRHYLSGNLFERIPFYPKLQSPRRNSSTVDIASSAKCKSPVRVLKGYSLCRVQPAEGRSDDNGVPYSYVLNTYQWYATYEV